MDPTLTWIDASEVRAAIALVRRAGPPPRPSTASASPEPSARLAPIEPLREPSTVAARIEALARWIERGLRPRRWFLADDQGLPIYDSGFGDARIGELTHSMQQWRPTGRPSPIEAVTYHLTGGRRLTALWVSTPPGLTAIALDSPETEDVAMVRSAVEYALRGRSY